ncbi:MAG: macrolide ABC transporter ATP-binding protein/permease [Acholeplasmatales bacterium]|jgi:ABC-type lipoprotein export system ATPase subunit|nr:macrolide ABC transporter ATP-binding protein/permease [Acholeplasmatales bacterium]
MKLQVINLVKEFKIGRSNTKVLNNVSYDFPDKGIVVIFGASGSGKSTLLNAISGMHKLNSGTIIYDDKKIDKYSQGFWSTTRRESIGFIFQNYNLILNMSVFENIAYVLRLLGVKDEKEIESRVNYVLKNLNIYNIRKKKAGNLSGGQQQRVAIARAIVKNPKYILADEPTGNLDSKNTVEVMNIIKAISKERLVVLVTHEEKIAKYYADYIINMKDGAIIKISENDSSNSSVSIDSNIYLKDLNYLKISKDDNINLDIYSDDSVDDLNITGRLIIRNKTLYLDINTQKKYKNIVFDESSGVKLIDDTRENIERDQINKTEFNWDFLETSGLDKSNKISFSYRRIFSNAYRNIVNLGKKGKFLVGTFIGAGLVIALLMSIISGLITFPEDFLTSSKSSYFVSEINNSGDHINVDLLNLLSNLDSEKVEFIPSKGTLNLVPLHLAISETFFKGELITVIAYPESDKALSSNKIISGRENSNPNEVVISKSFADNLLKNKSGFGFYNNDYKYILNSRFYRDENLKFPLTIVGIVDDGLTLSSGLVGMLSTCIYADGETLFTFSDIYEDFFGSIAGLNFLTHDLTYGSLDYEKEDEYCLVINETRFVDTFGVDKLSDSFFPYVVHSGSISKKIIGTYSGDDSYVYANLKLLKFTYLGNYYYQNKFKVYADSKDDVSAIINTLSFHENFIVESVYESAVRESRDINLENVTAMIPILASVLLYLFICYLFLIRSSFNSRRKRIVIDRCLGKKKSELIVSYLLEIICLSTITTILGYIIGSILISFLGGTIFGDLGFVKYTGLVYLLGGVLIYIVNIIAGLTPVIILLRKTPAELQSSYE